MIVIHKVAVKREASDGSVAVREVCVPSVCVERGDESRAVGRLEPQKVGERPRRALRREGTHEVRVDVHAAHIQRANDRRVHLERERRRIGVAVLCVRHLQRGLERRDDVASLREGDVSPMPVVGNPPEARVRAQTVGVLEVGKL